jgi:membrane protein required for colicin V production
MILLDILIWAVLIFFVAKGFSKGLIREACSLLGLVTGGWAAFRYYSSLSLGLRHFINLPQQVAQPLSFLLIFLLLGILFYLLGHLLTVIFKIMLLGGINRIGGILFGLLEGAFVICVVLYLATLKPVPDKMKKMIAASKTAQAFAATGADIAVGWEKRMPPMPPPNKGERKE